MFDLDPLSRPVAVVEMLLLLTFAAFVGWFLARLILNNRINALRSAIADQEIELDDCRRSNAKTPKAKRIDTQPVNRTTVAPIVTIANQESDDFFAPELPTPIAPLTLDPERPIIANPPPVAAMAGNSEAAILQRIAARASELNFDRIGLASAAEADDLKDIVGIGPFLERKLHSLGIYTFRQIASFGKEDIDKINDIIEFFPGRIERDNWVEQSRAFHERKYGNQP